MLTSECGPVNALSTIRQFSCTRVRRNAENQALWLILPGANRTDTSCQVEVWHQFPCAEDRATQGCDLSADADANTGDGDPRSPFSSPGWPKSDQSNFIHSPQILRRSRRISLLRPLDDPSDGRRVRATTALVQQRRRCIGHAEVPASAGPTAQKKAGP